jgi:hypothetical protein
MAIASLVLGIIAFPSICCYGIPAIALGVTALILGRVSLRKIRAANGMIGGNGLAQAGWICGLVAAVLGGLYGLVTLGILLLGIFGNSSGFPFATPSG